MSRWCWRERVKLPAAILVIIPQIRVVPNRYVEGGSERDLTSIRCAAAVSGTNANNLPRYRKPATFISYMCFNSPITPEDP
jgi:hypothetical protein